MQAPKRGIFPEVVRVTTIGSTRNPKDLWTQVLMVKTHIEQKQYRFKAIIVDGSTGHVCHIVNFPLSSL